MGGLQRNALQASCQPSSPARANQACVCTHPECTLLKRKLIAELEATFLAELQLHSFGDLELVGELFLRFFVADFASIFPLFSVV